MLEIGYCIDCKELNYASTNGNGARGAVEQGEDIAKALNDLARHKTIMSLYNDIPADMQVCEIEGWDKAE